MRKDADYYIALLRVLDLWVANITDGKGKVLTRKEIRKITGDQINKVCKTLKDHELASGEWSTDYNDWIYIYRKHPDNRDFREDCRKTLRDNETAKKEQELRIREKELNIENIPQSRRLSIIAIILSGAAIVIELFRMLRETGILRLLKDYLCSHISFLR